MKYFFVLLFLFCCCCSAQNNCTDIPPEDLSTQIPVLESVDLQEEYNSTLFVSAVGDFFESSLYIGDGGNLVQRVYWREDLLSYTANNQTFRKFDLQIFNSARIIDVAATAMESKNRVLYALATEDFELQVYILEIDQTNTSNIIITAMDNTIISPTQCLDDANRLLLIDAKCDWHVTNSSVVECFVFALECGTLHTYRLNETDRILDETTCLHTEFNFQGALSFQVEVSSFPSTNSERVLLFHTLISGFVGFNPAWVFTSHECDPALPLGMATGNVVVRGFLRSALAEDDAGAIILRTMDNSTQSLGQFRAWLLIPSPYFGNQVQFFDPMDFPGSLVNQDLEKPGFIKQLAASHTDYPEHKVDALFVVEFADPLDFVLAGVFGEDGKSFISSTTETTTPSTYDDRLLDMGTVYEFQSCIRPFPIVAVSLFRAPPNNTQSAGADVLLFNFTEPQPEPEPTPAPTPMPVVCGNSRAPIRSRSQLPLPNSVIDGALFYAECANNTWVRPGADPHCDNCEPYAGVFANNNSRPLWFSFETQHDPAVYMIYTDPSCDSCNLKGIVQHAATPLISSVVSLWSHCYYNNPVGKIDDCSTDPVMGMQADHGFLGPLCLPQDTVHNVRVRGNSSEDVGDFDLTIEEWSLRRGGDNCPAARPLDHIVEGENDLFNCKSAVYTNLCAPQAGRDLFVKCPAIGEQTVPTVWFSYETRSGGTGPSALRFAVHFNDSRSQAEHGILPFKEHENPLDVSFTLSVWRACETLLENPLLCETVSGTLDGDLLILDFPLLNVTEPLEATFVSKKLRPHTEYYIALSTTYQGDYAICVLEDQEDHCSKRPNAGNCTDVCETTPCNSEESLDSMLFVQNFNRSTFSAGDFGPALGLKMPGVDVIAYGKACRCCMQPMLFDSSNPSGDDCELGTPNRRYGGLGCGDGGAEGKGANFVDQGLCLIVSEDGDSIDPDSLRESGVVLSINFCTTVQLEYIVFINALKGTIVTLFDAQGEDYPPIPLKRLGKNAVLNMTFDDPRYAPPFVSKVEIEFGQGGACIPEFAYRIVGINNICNCPNDTFPNVGGPLVDGEGACCWRNVTEVNCDDYMQKKECHKKRGYWSPGRMCAEEGVCPEQGRVYWGAEYLNDAYKSARNNFIYSKEKSSSSSRSNKKHYK